MFRRVTAAALLAFCLGGLVPLSTAAGRRPPHHSTCGTFCKQAGGLGGSPGVAPCQVLGSLIHSNAGVASVTVRCSGRRTSRGAVAIYPHRFIRDYVNDGVPRGSYGGADLVAAPHHHVTVQILLSPKASALLTREHSLKVDVLIELNTKSAVQATTRFGLLLLPSP